jgi:hypothetical protein
MKSRLHLSDSLTNNSIIRVLSAEILYEAKKLSNNAIIARVKLKTKRNAIFCVNLDFSIKWELHPTLENDEYPNPIIWDSKIDENVDTWEKAYVANYSSFVTSSQRGITMTVNYDDGKISNSILTK